VFAPEAASPARTNAIVDVLVKLGTQLGLEVVAQHLETPTDLEVARTAGCRYGQGRVFSPPVPTEHLEAYFDRFGVA
jgi:diguanylate cyclase